MFAGENVAAWQTALNGSTIPSTSSNQYETSCRNMNYNLRSRKLKRPPMKCPCYLQEHLKETLMNGLIPVVRLERLDILENSQTDTFYCQQGKKIAIDTSTGRNLKKRNIKNFAIVLLFLILASVILKDNLQNYQTILSWFSAPTQNFELENKIQFCKKGLENYFKTERSNQVLEDGHCELESDIALDYKEVKQIAKDLISELKKIDQFNEESPNNFIDQQCQKELFTEAYGTRVDANYYNSAIPDYFNITDYALESEGAKVITVFDTEFYGTFTLKFWDYDFEGMHTLLKSYLTSKLASSILVPWKKAGDCWAFKGSRGQILIKLSKKIIITSITYDHISEDLSCSRNISSAPKKFVISGIEDIEDGSQHKIHLVSYEYKVPGPSVQSFLVKPEVNKAFIKIEVKIESNHGNTQYTCVYKIRVHGYS